MNRSRRCSFCWGKWASGQPAAQRVTDHGALELHEQNKRKTKRNQPHMGGDYGCKAARTESEAARAECEGKKERWRRRQLQKQKIIGKWAGSMNQRSAFFSNGKLRPEHSGLSITEIELPPYWLCTKQTISRMRAKCYSPYKPCCISSPLPASPRCTLNYWGCTCVSAKRGCQRITANITKSHFHWKSSEAKTFPWFAEHAERAGRDVSYMFNSDAPTLTSTCGHDTAFFKFFFCFSEICFGVGPRFSSTIAPAVLAQWFRTCFPGPGYRLLLVASLICPVSEIINTWSGACKTYVPPIGDLKIPLTRHLFFF